ncbi:disease resistance protein RPP13-like isoform X2 [Salvia splendens]|uniref:disease resistance protein RPP13-like isoform X2 n=1 Tax=Salvia splendens TaxID=180675 RepID=UPI001C2541E2|nr:disease resistance protein RPP13-like isoform X2 [Salvia splendens]
MSLTTARSHSGNRVMLRLVFGEDVTNSTAATSSSSSSSSRPAPTITFFAADFDEDPSASPPTSRDDVVGFDKDILHMIDRITDYSYSNQEILPIVGMGGIGKSTLAKYSYHHPLIMEHFDIRGWVTISQDYIIPSILSQLLASLNGKVHQVGRDSLIVIKAEKLEIYKILLGRRYLIIMDDMWSTEAWDHVQRLFPNNHNGSRIILTTRLMEVATYAATGQKIHMMSFLDDEQIWRLFHHKVFGDQDCPDELRSVGEKNSKRMWRTAPLNCYCGRTFIEDS